MSIHANIKQELDSSVTSDDSKPLSNYPENATNTADDKSTLENLIQARTLALEQNTAEMLPKVLETTSNLLFQKTEFPQTPSSKNEYSSLAHFYIDLFHTLLINSRISNIEKSLIASAHFHELFTLITTTGDPILYKSAILTYSQTYPLLLDLVAKTSNEKLWSDMTKLKRFIISNWKSIYPLSTCENGIISGVDLDSDDKNMGCKLASVKFMSQVIISQISSSSSSSLAIPDNHPVLGSQRRLEKEAKAILDLLLNYLIDEPMMVSSLFIGILNVLAFILKARSQTTVRILSGILKFNVDGKYMIDEKNVLKYRLSKRMVERCYKNFAQFGIKNQLIKNDSPSSSSGAESNTSTTSSSNFYGKFSKISQTLHIIGEETKAKGILNYEETAFINIIPDNERSRIMNNREKFQLKKTIDFNNNLLTDLKNYSLEKLESSGNDPNRIFNNSTIAIDNSYSSIFSLMNSDNSKFDLSQFKTEQKGKESEILIQLASEALSSVDTNRFINALSIVASRYTDLMNKTPNPKEKRSHDDTDNNNNNNNNKEIEEDGYDFNSSEIPTKKLKMEPSQEDDVNKYKVEEDEEDEEEEEAIKTTDLDDTKYLFKLEPMDRDTKIANIKRIIQNILSVKDQREENSLMISANNSNNNQDIFSPLNKIKLIDWKNENSGFDILIRLASRGVDNNENSGLCGDIIRDNLYEYMLQDFDNKVGLMVEWLNEEWYFESISKSFEFATYNKWSLRLLDGLIPFLENNHRRLFIRLMSELPKLTMDHINKMRQICMDPARNSLGFQTLKFLVMFRPPVKGIIKEFLESILKEDATLEKQCNSILSKFY
ncbi:RNA-processing protein PTA1 NDAI_0H01920 [Naumovozyma dairenensis CBS 421]|uniref:Symplekin/Pta1 N-terminal domain-containing protein n=1 Tax=Naumovozyma dairenensis (strain ATCC 10597 / BCRC 20456 / CBS 421 / NBRC 0211 / NRRL Y-12639) TaxID=1071378 RepID=G0WF05_NAUDC|nr:hypothetical protein NDAI_0H01920 [Naumovozyma dairenensis CBS 421]CCD26366.1 hypothetical protein NDAI_0H01920 [Naumovozyma dairenensis CBS 421]